MSDIIIALGDRDNVFEDISILAKKVSENPEVIISTGKEIKNHIIEKSSALFIEQNIVMAFVDPSDEIIHSLEHQLLVLKERLQIILYYTSATKDFKKPIEGKEITFSKDKEKRTREHVLGILKKYDKVMTDKAFTVFKKKIKDESILEMELIKLINFIGERKEIRSKDVLAVVTETHEDSLFSLFDELSRMKKKEALNILENLLQNRLPIIAIQGFLVKQTRLLLQAKDMEGIFQPGLEYPLFQKTYNKWKEGLGLKPNDKKQHFPYQKPYYAYNLSKASQKFKRKKLVDFFDNLTDFDIKMKSGSKFERILLEHGLLET